MEDSLLALDRMKNEFIFIHLESLPRMESMAFGDNFT